MTGINESDLFAIMDEAYNFSNLIPLLRQWGLFASYIIIFIFDHLNVIFWDECPWFFIFVVVVMPSWFTGCLWGARPFKGVLLFPTPSVNLIWGWNNKGLYFWRFVVSYQDDEFGSPPLCLWFRHITFMFGKAFIFDRFY